ncbi:uncharacterized protein N7515_003826 [Penicillium bovifimosum]|uniref:Uncharacterized protein n=1 Tax=Penicillium bovifimosum TaxID=126998 RepID=A0A9W9H5K0_9EURO|nr:uncharacterized protein N7515_003826 [Penicillium bovifimosum]KAJ5138978.1 hypothetical protein N7515_003826 [Penicillium bovifimosum]
MDEAGGTGQFIDNTVPDTSDRWVSDSHHYLRACGQTIALRGAVQTSRRCWVSQADWKSRARHLPAQRAVIS